MSLFHKAWGFRGLSLFRGLGVGLLVSSLAVQAFRRTTPGRALAVTALAVFGTLGGWGERPQLLSFLLLIPTAQLIRSAVAHDGARLWRLVPLTYLWANLHGLWFLAPTLVFIGALGAATRPNRSTRAWLAARPFLLVGVSCVAAASLTPNGPAVLLEPLRVNAYGQFVSEWGPPNIHSPFGLAFFLMVGLFLIAFARSTDRPSNHTLIQVLFAILLGVLYIRTIAPAVVILTPLLADVLGRAARTRPGFPPLFARSAAAVLVTLGFAGAAIVLTQEPELPPAAPVAATRAMVAAVDGQPRVLNDYGIGGWILLFAPTARPAIDGRAEIYPLTYVANYLAATKMTGDWKATIAPLHANVAMLHRTTPLVNGLRDAWHWRTVYQDDTWLVLVPPSSTSGKGTIQ